MNTLFDIWNNIQSTLFPWLEEDLDPLTEKEQKFVKVVSLGWLEIGAFLDMSCLKKNISLTTGIG